MAKRRTIGRDPLSIEMVASGYSAEIVSIPVRPAPISQPEPTPAAPVADTKAGIVVDDKCKRIVGGRLEILGGDFGTGSRPIWPFSSDDEIGFDPPSGRRIDLCRELVAVHAWPDRTEHRYISAAGWAWVLASLGGIIGLLAGGGLRLIQPQRMMVAIELDGGAKLVARTDSVTVAGLRAIATRRAATA